MLDYNKDRDVLHIDFLPDELEGARDGLAVGNNKMKEKCVVVYYDSDNFNEAIDREMKRRGIKEGEMVIIAIPKSLMRMGVDLAHTRQ